MSPDGWEFRFASEDRESGLTTPTVSPMDEFLEGIMWCRYPDGGGGGYVPCGYIRFRFCGCAYPIVNRADDLRAVGRMQTMSDSSPKLWRKALARASRSSDAE